MIDPVRTRWPRSPLAAGCLWIRCSGRAAAGVPASTCRVGAARRSTVNDSDRELVLAHVDDANRIIGNRALGIGRIFQHGFDVFIADDHGIVRCLGESTYRTGRT